MANNSKTCELKRQHFGTIDNVSVGRFQYQDAKIIPDIKDGIHLYVRGSNKDSDDAKVNAVIQAHTDLINAHDNFIEAKKIADETMANNRWGLFVSRGGNAYGKLATTSLVWNNFPSELPSETNATKLLAKLSTDAGEPDLDKVRAWLAVNGEDHDVIRESIHMVTEDAETGFYTFGSKSNWQHLLQDNDDET